MRHISKKKWNYCEPSVRMTRLSLEALICQSVRFNVQVDEIHNMNTLVNKEDRDTSSDPFYFEF